MNSSSFNWHTQNKHKYKHNKPVQVHVSFVTGEIQNFLSVCCVVPIHQQLKSNFNFKPSKPHWIYMTLESSGRVTSKSSEKKQVITFHRIMIQQIMYIVVKLYKDHPPSQTIVKKHVWFEQFFLYSKPATVSKSLH